jgi:hypothetical protein
MRKIQKLLSVWTVGGTLLILIGCVILPLSTLAQQPGDKAVFDSNGKCSPCASSSALLDASVLSGGDICQKIYNALQSIPAGPQVVDARGISTPAQCTGNETPWLNSGNNAIVASTILLPAGTITISSSWVLPDGTRLIGEGTGTSDAAGTVLQAPSGFSGTMIQMGDAGVHCPAAGHICHGVSVEDLTLDGEGQNIGGILNSNSQELSYVNHVKFYQVMGTGLTVSTSAQNSGPYSKITYDTGNMSPIAQTSCAKINNAIGTRGIHGLTCISATNAPNAAVSLDSSNNSIEDVLIEGFNDGIAVGAGAVAQNNVLFNILGDTTFVTQTQGPTPLTVIHISNNFTGTGDLSMVGIRNTGTTLTIVDDITTTTLSDAAVSMYALGESGGSGYSRFTTSPNAATWAVGMGAPSGGCTSTGTSFGSLYSNTSTSGGSLWVCETSGWVSVR